MADDTETSAAGEPWSRIVSLTGPDRAASRDFLLTPDAEARAALARLLDIDGVKKLRFEGRLSPEGKRDWKLQAKLGATVVQPCSVTLVPVSTRIDVDVTRRYLADLPEPLAGEVEMPEDDTIEPLPSTLDLGAVMAEALALALPDFPRAEGVELGPAVFTKPGTQPMTDEAGKAAGRPGRTARADEEGRRRRR